MKTFVRALGVVCTVFLLVSFPACQKNPTEPTSTAETATGVQDPSHLFKTAATTMTEDFEAGTKTAYATGDVVFTSGTWTLNDALVGTSASDAKNGSKSIRIRNSGILTMKFNRTDGASIVTIKHAKYGSDASTIWGLWYSTNSGTSWTQTGSTVTSSSTTLQTATFTVNVAGTIRFELRKTDGAANRTNIDDFTINSYGTQPPPSGSEHLTMGNPSGAVHDISYTTNYLMEKPQYVISYHRDRAIPNWVAWHLDNTWLGSAARQDDFRADTSLPAGWYQVQATSYSGSGYDRGHHCPSADRTSSVANNSATFLMTNMMPQSANNNQGPWMVLEDSCRALVSKGFELYIYCGGYGSQGTLQSGKITIPSHTWKVIMVLPNGTNDVSRVTTTTRLIAVDMPNSDSQISRTANWKSYRVSVDQIESITGYDFFSNVPASIQTVIESKVDAL